jgi:hypothetical protein
MRYRFVAVAIGIFAGLAQAQEEGEFFTPPLGALAPENLNAERPPPPFDLTGTWFVDLNATPSSWRFGPPYPEFTEAAQVHIDASREATAEGKVYRDDIGQCWPAGLPLIMTRVWPIAMIQIPTAIYMISGFMNSLRIVYTDGREHTPEDIVVRSFNGRRSAQNHRARPPQRRDGPARDRIHDDGPGALGRRVDAHEVLQSRQRRRYRRGFVSS